MGSKGKRSKRSGDDKHVALKSDRGSEASASGTREGHSVWVGHVPSSLCANELEVRDLFSEFGMLLSVTIHHNFVDMSTDGFMYLSYASQTEAASAVAAVNSNHLTAAQGLKSGGLANTEALAAMQAALALSRGRPHTQTDEELRDLLLGRRHANLYSQQSAHGQDDDEELMLQSLSQHSFGGSQQRKKRRRGSHRASQG